jgi:2-polyprenyl-3-methyl-5-hydroxy-6-metoxy-1,4-benzoquinol methylase
MADLASRWDDQYRTRKNPWDTGRPDRALQRIVEEARITPCRTLELGCGRGANAVFLAQQGFDVTAVDVSQVALDTARVRARSASATVRFLQADVLELPELGPPFAFVFDRGCYHTCVP